MVTIDADARLDRNDHGNAKDEHGNAAVHVAADNGHLGLTQVVLESGADNNATAQDGRSALYGAAG